jgi:hypothetical protein
MLVRVCDRCGAAAQPAAATRALVVDKGDPSTTPLPKTAVDFGVSLGIVPAGNIDLCDVCLASGLLEFLLTRLGAAGLRDLVQAFAARIKAAIQAGG